MATVHLCHPPYQGVGGVFLALVILLGLVQQLAKLIICLHIVQVREGIVGKGGQGGLVVSDGLVDKLLIAEVIVSPQLVVIKLVLPTARLCYPWFQISV